MAFTFPPTTTAGSTVPATTVPGFQFGSITGGGDALNLKPFATPTSTTSTTQAAGTTASVTSTSSSPFSLPTTATPNLNLTTSSSNFLQSTAAAPTVPTTSGLSSIFGTTGTTNSSLGTSLASTKTTTPSITSALPSSNTLTFGQLEDAINKWTIDLEEQSKHFANQAKQINAWDRLLMSNADKISSLGSGIDRVKQQQQQLDQELDFILAQQKELEDLITPLEKELANVVVTDMERNYTYQNAKKIDSDLKQISEDLKEIVEHLNESNKDQEMSNPITQISKILNAHMQSLQWVDQNTVKISTQLDQVSKLYELNKRNHEISIQKIYN